MARSSIKKKIEQDGEDFSTKSNHSEKKTPPLQWTIEYLRETLAKPHMLQKIEEIGVARLGAQIRLQREYPMFGKLFLSELSHFYWMGKVTPVDNLLLFLQKRNERVLRLDKKKEILEKNIIPLWNAVHPGRKFGKKLKESDELSLSKEDMCDVLWMLHIFLEMEEFDIGVKLTTRKNLQLVRPEELRNIPRKLP